MTLNIKAVFNPCARCGRRLARSGSTSVLCPECRADIMDASSHDCDHCGWPLRKLNDHDMPVCLYALCPPHVRKVRIIQAAGLLVAAALCVAAFLSLR